jgi:hypothetical protein
MSKNRPVKLVAPEASSAAAPTQETQPTPATTPAQPGARAVFEFLSQHILLVTALAAVTGVATATAGLSAYLRVFDWRLIWVIEYPDVLKWGLVAVGMVLPLAYFAWAFMRDAIDWVLGSSKYGIIIGLVIWVVSLTAWLVFDYRSAEPHYALTFFVHMAVLLLIMTTVNIAQSVKLWPVSLRGLAGDFVLVIATAGVIGTAIGHVFRDSAGFQQHVTTKTTEYRSVGLVMITSRYVIIYDRDHVVTIPVEDVRRIEGQPRPASGW